MGGRGEKVRIGPMPTCLHAHTIHEHVFLGRVVLEVEDMSQDQYQVRRAPYAGLLAEGLFGRNGDLPTTHPPAAIPPRPPSAAIPPSGCPAPPPPPDEGGGGKEAGIGPSRRTGSFAPGERYVPTRWRKVRARHARAAEGCVMGSPVNIPGKTRRAWGLARSYARNAKHVVGPLANCILHSCSSYAMIPRQCIHTVRLLASISCTAVLAKPVRSGPVSAYS